MRNRALPPSARSAPRRHGQSPSDTRARQLLDAAGQVFAEKGFDRATAKEICERAGMNAASVNYYFGGIEGLYAAAVEEAQGQIPGYRAVVEAFAGKTDPEAKLRALLELIVRALTSPAVASWKIRVISREFFAPSRVTEVLRRKQIEPKGRIIRSLVGELMGLPEDHPAVARSCISLMAPCITLLIGDRRSLQRTLPRLELGADHTDALVDHMFRYARAGLAAVGRELRKRDPSRRSRYPRRRDLRASAGPRAPGTVREDGK